MKEDFLGCLEAKVGFKGFGIAQDKLSTTVPFVFDNREYVLRHGSVLIAAITSCTNTSNPRYNSFIAYICGYSLTVSFLFLCPSGLF